MKIVVFLIVVFILLFFLLFRFVYRENKKEHEKDKIWLLIFVAFLFSIIIIIVIALLLFLLIGSTSIINLIFSLNINNEQIIIIGISFLIYLFTIDNIVEIFLEYLLGKNIICYIAKALTRVVSFYIIGLIVNIEHEILVIISIGVSVILLLIELLNYKKEKESEK